MPISNTVISTFTLGDGGMQLAKLEWMYGLNLQTSHSSLIILNTLTHKTFRSWNPFWNGSLALNKVVETYQKNEFTLLRAMLKSDWLLFIVTSNMPSVDMTNSMFFRDSGIASYCVCVRGWGVWGRWGGEVCEGERVCVRGSRKLNDIIMIKEMHECKF